VNPGTDVTPPDNDQPFHQADHGQIRGTKLDMHSLVYLACRSTIGSHPSIEVALGKGFVSSSWFGIASRMYPLDPQHHVVTPTASSMRTSPLYFLSPSRCPYGPLFITSRLRSS
jgi:hypothetical protein